MSTPDFVPQNNSNYTSIRYYTAQDPIYYTVDNRPLTDLETNIKADRQYGGDSARRAAIFNAFNYASTAADLYVPPSFNTSGMYMTGLAVSVPSTNNVTIGPGAVYQPLQVSTSVTNVIMKQALLMTSLNFTLTAPVSAGTSIIYTIEGLRQDLTTSQMSVTNIPDLDSTNPLLPGLLIHGELTLNLNAGIAATTGSQVAPATTSGHIPLYNITLTYGVSNPTITAHPNSPYIKGLYQHSTPVALASGGATIGLTNNIPSASFAAGAVSGVALPIVGMAGTTNPYKPIRVKLTFASTASGGNAVFQLQYVGLASGNLVTTAMTTTSTEVVAIAGAANAIQTNITATAIVPNTAFSGLVGNLWSITELRTAIVLQRVGTNGSDTNTGSIVLIDAVLLQ